MSVSTSAPHAAEKENPTLYNPMHEPPPISKMFDEEEEKDGDYPLGMYIALVIFALIWLAAGTAGYFMSLHCGFARTGSAKQKWIGWLIASCLGPFYWVYFYLARKKGYCQKQSQ